MKLKELTGLKFGRLTVLEREINQGKHVLWSCECDCGNKKNVISTNLLSGKVRSCGCLAIEKSTQRLLKLPRKIYEKGRGSANYLWNRYRQTAKKRDLPFELSKNLFFIMTSSDCYYCGLPPSLKVKGLRNNGEFHFNGIDRKDSNIGYIADNCVPACHWCNQAKNDYSYEDFKKWISFVRTGVRK